MSSDFFIAISICVVRYAMAFIPALDQLLCFSLYSASMAINRTYKPLLDELGITYPQYLVLNVLWEEDGRTVGSIAERLALESSTITPLVKRLEAASLVTRTRNREDERRVLVALTRRGRELREKKPLPRRGTARALGNGTEGTDCA